MKFPLGRADESFVVAKIPHGRFENIRVYAFPDSYCGLAAVCVSGDIEREALTIEQATELGRALLKAAQKAGGTIMAVAS